MNNNRSSTAQSQWPQSKPISPANPASVIPHGGDTREDPNESLPPQPPGRGGTSSSHDTPPDHQGVVEIMKTLLWDQRGCDLILWPQIINEKLPEQNNRTLAEILELDRDDDEPDLFTIHTQFLEIQEEMISPYYSLYQILNNSLVTSIQDIAKEHPGHRYLVSEVQRQLTSKNTSPASATAPYSIPVSPFLHPELAALVAFGLTYEDFRTLLKALREGIHHTVNALGANIPACIRSMRARGMLTEREDQQFPGAIDGQKADEFIDTIAKKGLGGPLCLLRTFHQLRMDQGLDHILELISSGNPKKRLTAAIKAPRETGEAGHYKQEQDWETNYFDLKHVQATTQRDAFQRQVMKQMLTLENNPRIKQFLLASSLLEFFQRYQNLLKDSDAEESIIKELRHKPAWWDHPDMHPMISQIAQYKHNRSEKLKTINQELIRATEAAAAALVAQKRQPPPHIHAASCAIPPQTDKEKEQMKKQLEEGILIQKALGIRLEQQTSAIQKTEQLAKELIAAKKDYIQAQVRHEQNLQQVQSIHEGQTKQFLADLTKTMNEMKKSHQEQLKALESKLSIEAPPQDLVYQFQCAVCLEEQDADDMEIYPCCANWLCKVCTEKMFTRAEQKDQNMTCPLCRKIVNRDAINPVHLPLVSTRKVAGK